MNQFIEYVCRGVIRSEDAIKRLNKGVADLAKTCRITNARVTCVAISGLLVMAVVAMQDKEIKALKKQVADLAKDDEPVADDTADVANDVEEQNEQEGA